MDNYDRLHDIVNKLTSGSSHRTPEWYDEHNHILLQYQKVFGSFSTVNPEITDETFRMKCIVVDTLLFKLMKEYDAYRWFSLYDYNRLNQTLIWLVDFANKCENELSDILSGLKL